MQKSLKQQIEQRAKEWVFMNLESDLKDPEKSYIQGANALFNIINKDELECEDETFKQNVRCLFKEQLENAKKHLERFPFEFKSITITFEDGLINGGDICVTAIDQENKTYRIL